MSILSSELHISMDGGRVGPANTCQSRKDLGCLQVRFRQSSCEPLDVEAIQWGMIA